MNKFAILLSALAFACGGVYDPRTETDEHVEIADLHQELITQVSSKNESQCNMISGSMHEVSPLDGLTYGAVSCMMSDRTVYVPRTNQVTLKPVNANCSTAHFDRMVAQLDIIIAELNTQASLGLSSDGTGGWVFSRSSSGTHPIECTSVATSPAGVDRIRNFVRVAVSPADGIVNDSDNVMDGAFFKGWTKLTIQVDVADIVAYAGTTTQENRVLWHAVASGVEKLTGTGEFAGVRLAASDTTADQNATGRVMFSSGERCRARNFSFTQPANMFWSTVAGCANN